MSGLRVNQPPKPSWENESRLATLSMYAPQWQVHTAAKPQGYPESMRKRAMEMYVDGNNLGRIAGHLKVAPQTVAYWVTNLAEALPKVPLPSELKEAEMDELFTFIGDKNTKSTVQASEFCAFRAGDFDQKR